MKRSRRAVKFSLLLILTSKLVFTHTQTEASTRRPGQCVLVMDPSKSVRDSKQSVVGLAAACLDSFKHAEGLSLDVLSFGDAVTAYEPIYVGHYEITVDRRVRTGPHGWERKRNEILAKLHSDIEAVQAREDSPIFLTIKRAAQLFKGRCGITIECRLSVETDGEENQVEAIRSALNSGVALKVALPPRINNQQMVVDFCGSAQTIGNATVDGKRVSMTPKRNPWSVDRAQQIWLALFQYPELVTFEPFCPIWTAD